MRVADVVKKYMFFEMYKVYPIEYWVVRQGNEYLVLEVPRAGATKVQAYVIPVNDREGLVLYRFPDTAVVTAYTVSAGIEEKPSLVPKLMDRLYWFLSRREPIPNLTPHSVKGISVLWLVPEEYVRETQRYFELREKLRDRVTAVFPDFVVVFTRDKFMERIDGEDAVRLAKKVSFTVDAPVSFIAETLSDALRTREITVFMFEEGSVFCSTKTCVPVPLPRNITELVIRALRKDRHTVKVIDRTSEKTGNLSLPGYIFIAPNEFGFIKPVSGDTFIVLRSYPVHTSVMKPVVYSARGFEGYMKKIGNYVKIVKTLKTAERGEEYLETVMAEA